MTENIRPVMMLLGQVIVGIVSLGACAITLVTDSILRFSNGVRR